MATNDWSTLRQEVMTLGELISDNSGGRARLAVQEEDETESKADDAAHFIKVDGKRVGRDLELYGFMGDKAIGWESTLADILLEVLIPIKGMGLTESYEAASKVLKEMGHQVYSPDKLEQWDALF